MGVPSLEVAASSTKQPNGEELVQLFDLGKTRCSQLRTTGTLVEFYHQECGLKQLQMGLQLTAKGNLTVLWVVGDRTVLGSACRRERIEDSRGHIWKHHLWTTVKASGRFWVPSMASPMPYLGYIKRCHWYCDYTSSYLPNFRSSCLWYHPLHLVS